jgi:short-subunit dehydrogenase
MLHPLAIVVSGAAPNSLGECLVQKLRGTCSDSPIIVIDRHYNPNLSDIQGVHMVIVDLNPFSSERGYDGVVNDLDQAIPRAIREIGAGGVATAILGAGTYESGSLLETSLEARQKLIGVNVCGKVELLHAVLAINDKLGFPSRRALTLVDIGTLHALTASPNRSLYVATKAMGLDLCITMKRGGEVSRAMYLAPGPIDTHMLHRNHWVSKERGSVEFFEYVRTQNARLYRDIFMNCDDVAFAEAVSSSGLKLDELATVFSRYRIRRREQFSDRNGVLCVDDLAKRVVAIIADRGAHTDGVYVFTAANEQVQMRWLPFSDVARWDAC